MAEHDETSLTSGMVVSRRHAVMGGLLLATGIAAGMRLPKDRYPVIESDLMKEWIPNSFGQWRRIDSNDVVLPPEDSLRDRLYDNLLTRVYRHQNGDEVMFLMAYNNRQDGMLQVHRPEVCYPTGGYTLTDTEATAMSLGDEEIPSSRFTASNSQRTEHVLYFTRVGTGFPRTWAQQRAEVMKANLEGYVPDGLMFRASSLMRDASAAIESMRNFSAELYQASSPELQELLVGNE